MTIDFHGWLIARVRDVDAPFELWTFDEDQQDIAEQLYNTLATNWTEVWLAHITHGPSVPPPPSHVTWQDERIQHLEAALQILALEDSITYPGAFGDASYGELKARVKLAYEALYS
jgi:hypothetical protein